MKNIKEKITAENLIMAGVFIIVSIMLFWKCRYGSPVWTDEAFYPTIAHRLLQGDRLLYDEWHVTQLVSVVIMPILKLYMVVNGSTDGVYLALRYLYVVLKILISIFIYFRLKKYNRFGAYLSSVIFLLYAGLVITAISYNTVSIGGVLCALLFLFNEKDCVKTRIYWVLAGVALSIGVLGIPYNAFLYIAYAVAVVVVSFVVKKRERAGKAFQNKTVVLCYSYKAFGFVTIGVGICLCAFLVYLFRTVTLQQIVESIPYILTQDAGHPSRNIFVATFKFMVRALMPCNHDNYAATAAYVAVLLVLGIYLLDKKKKERTTRYAAIFGGMSVVLLVTLIITENHINFIIFIPNILAIIFLIIFKDELYQTMFAMIIAPGIVLEYAAYQASNTGAYAIASASSAATVGSVLIIVSVAQKYWRRNPDIGEKAVRSVLCVFLALALLSLAYYRLFTLYGGEKISAQKILIETGPVKGLMVSEQYSEMYEKVLADTEQIRSMPTDTKVAIIGNTFLWMTIEQRCGAHTTDVRLTPLKKFYEVHPDMIADVIYVQDGYETNAVDELTKSYGYVSTRLSCGWLLERK